MTLESLQRELSLSPLFLSRQPVSDFHKKFFPGLFRTRDSAMVYRKRFRSRRFVRRRRRY